MRIIGSAPARLNESSSSTSKREMLSPRGRRIASTSRTAAEYPRTSDTSARKPAGSG